MINGSRVTRTICKHCIKIMFYLLGPEQWTAKALLLFKALLLLFLLFTWISPLSHASNFTKVARDDRPGDMCVLVEFRPWTMQDGSVAPPTDSHNPQVLRRQTKFSTRVRHTQTHKKPSGRHAATFTGSPPFRRQVAISPMSRPRMWCNSSYPLKSTGFKLGHITRKPEINVRRNFLKP